MCGIAGYLNLDGAPARDNLLREMAERIAARTPAEHSFTARQGLRTEGFQSST